MQAKANGWGESGFSCGIFVVEVHVGKGGAALCGVPEREE
jgi:hypothetical protein